MSVEIDARDDHDAHESALRLSELIKSPMVKMAVMSEGVQLTSDVIVHQPERT